MDWFFGKEPTLKEQQRNNDKLLRTTDREVERDRRHLEREEKQLILEIKKNVKEGNQQACKVLAKQLVQIRKQKNRTFEIKSKISGVRSQNRMIGTNAKLTEAMATTAKTMKNINQVLKPEQVAATANSFREASMKMDMTDEMINDSLDDILNDSDDEKETDAIVSQVLDEIGIEISGKMAAAPRADHKLGPSKSSLPSDEELESQLAKLKS